LTFEVGWKVVQLLVREQGLDANSPRQASQQAFALGWITDEEVWADIIRARNTAVHVYREEYAEALYRELGRYYQAFEQLQAAIEAAV
jgi:nucleotidyltransferase substrate binding protein (TIGR01987 family)